MVISSFQDNTSSSLVNRVVSDDPTAAERKCKIIIEKVVKQIMLEITSKMVSRASSILSK
jgi:hypothetical protein